MLCLESVDHYSAPMLISGEHEAVLIDGAIARTMAKRFPKRQAQ